MTYREDIADDVIPSTEILSGTPLVYELDSDLRPLPKVLFRCGSWRLRPCIVEYLEDLPVMSSLAWRS